MDYVIPPANSRSPATSRHLTKIEDAYHALLSVGEDGGRGFVVEALNGERYVITDILSSPA